MALFDKLKIALGDIRAKHDDLVNQREKLLQRREDLQSLPLTKTDFLELLNQGIDDYQADYVKRMQQTVDDFNSRGNSLSAAGQIKAIPVMAPWSGQPNTAIMPVAILALMGDQVKASLSKVVGDLEWPKAGPSLANRKKEIKTIDGQIAKLDKELATLKDISRQSGIVLSQFDRAAGGQKALPGELRNKNTGLKPGGD